jgi:hypothetical protein
VGQLLLAGKLRGRIERQQAIINLNASKTWISALLRYVLLCVILVSIDATRDVAVERVDLAMQWFWCVLTHSNFTSGSQRRAARASARAVSALPGNASGASKSSEGALPYSTQGMGFAISRLVL